MIVMTCHQRKDNQEALMVKPVRALCVVVENFVLQRQGIQQVTGTGVIAKPNPKSSVTCKSSQ